MDNKILEESSGNEMEIEGHRSRKLIKRVKQKRREMSRARSKGSHPKGRDQNLVK